MEQLPSVRDWYTCQGQGFLLVFSLTSPSSLAELQELRDQILHVKNNLAVPMVLHPPNPVHAAGPPPRIYRRWATSVTWRRTDAYCGRARCR